jgi:alcohol dehydrogenase YqhD (iron-dependent ADH family)
VILTCIESGEKLMKDLSNIKLRSDISLSSSVALMGLPNAGRAGNWVVHPMELAISALHDNVAHGSGIAAILPAYLQYISKSRPERVIKMGKRIFDISEDVKDDIKIAMTIEAVKEFIISIGLKDCLKDIGIGQDELEKIADKVIETGGVPPPVKDRAELVSIYKDAF